MKKIALNIGCGPDIAKDTDEYKWINVDKYPLDPKVQQGDITRLFDFKDNSVDYIKCHYILEHLDYPSEKYAWHEMVRILKKGGKLEIRVPDILHSITKWMEAKDDWRGFYKITTDKNDPEYGFCNGPGLDNKWGVLLTWIYGSQSQPGLFHINAYTEKKLMAILKYFKLKPIKLNRFPDREGVALEVVAEK